MCKPSVRPTLKPRLDAASDLVTPQVGSSVILSCEAHGVPEPEVTWYKNGLQLAQRNGFEMDRYKLEIVGVQVRKDFDVTHLRLQTKREYLEGLWKASKTNTSNIQINTYFTFTHSL